MSMENDSASTSQGLEGFGRVNHGSASQMLLLKMKELCRGLAVGQDRQHLDVAGTKKVSTNAKMSF